MSQSRPRRPQSGRGAHRSSGRLAPLPGQATYLSLLWQRRGPVPAFLPDVTEALLTRTRAGHVFVEVAGVGGAAAGRDSEDDQALARVFDRGGERVVSVIRMDPIEAATDGSTHLDLNVHVYEKGPPDEPLRIGVGDRVLFSIQRAAGEDLARRRDPAAALEWVTQRLVLPTLPGSGPGARKRAVISAAPRYDGGEPIAFRIHGRGIAADVKVEEDYAVLLRVRQRAHESQLGPLRLVHRDIAFTDVSTATQLREEMKQQLARLAAGEGFLALWRRYNRMESWWLHRLVRETGSARYRQVHRLLDDSYRFTLVEASGPDGSASPLLEEAERSMRDGEPLELEAATSLPPVLARTSPEPKGAGEWGLLDDELPEGTVSGHVVSVDAVAGTIDLKLIELERPQPGRIARERSYHPPGQGHLYRSYRGDRRRLLRHREAFDRVLRGETRIPNLLSLLEGGLAPNEVASRRIEAKSEAAWACFRNGSPTARQERAMEVALNTPDIALIQGPPGTGKTQLIAALQTRLAEEGRGHAHLRGSMLLSSFQHAAVDELVERSVIFGLPATKIDRAGRGTTVQADRWRDDTIQRLTAFLGATPEGRGLTALRRVAAIAAGYLLAPVTGDVLIGQLREVEEIAASMLPGRLCDRLRAARAALELARITTPVALTEEQQLALLAVRGIRFTVESFGDDGPRTAAKALRRLRTLGHDDVPTLAVLERAAGWSGSERPPFLDDLTAIRTALLDRLTRVPGPSADPAVDPDVRALLEDVVQALEDYVASSRGEGVVTALFEYREALQGDPEAVLWTLREYTASYATTCQQVSSRPMREAKQLSTGESIIFDTVIIDEAARANPLDLIIPMVHAGRRIILVGDQNQLPHMLEPDVEEGFGADERSQLTESLFQRLFESLGRKDAPVQRVVTLDRQFRMHPTLGEFISRNFYGGTLASPRPAAELAHGLDRFRSAAAAWLSVPGGRGQEGGGQSKLRVAEARVIAGAIGPLLDAAPDMRFGVVAFYRTQVRHIWMELASRGLATRGPAGYEIVERLRYSGAGQRLDRLHVGTVDEFQGKEFDVVFLSLTRCLPPQERPPRPTHPGYASWVRRRYGHLVLRNRMCVAMSRQQRLLVAVGDPATFAAPTAPTDVGPLTDFLELCRKGGPDGIVLS